MLVAAGRSDRPNAHRPDPSIDTGYDPFLEGNEIETPSERLALRTKDSQPNEPGWQLRIVPNRYPAVDSSHIAGDQSQATAGSFGQPEWTAAATDYCGVQSNASASPLLPQTPAVGIHDVVIECPDHRTSLLNLTIHEIAQVLTAWKLRIRQLRSSQKFDGIAVFRNEGFSAGGSLAHCHSQIVATTELMPLQLAYVQRAEEYHRSTGRKLADDWLQAEIHDGRRMLQNDDEFAWLCPFASRVAWQVRCLPTQFPRFAFDQLDAQHFLQIATALFTMLQTLKQLLGPFSFNVTLVHAPFSRPEAHSWMLDILPRRGRLAGWELLTDVDIVTTPPEECAARMRGQIPATRQLIPRLMETEAEAQPVHWTSFRD